MHHLRENCVDGERNASAPSKILGARKLPLRGPRVSAESAARVNLREAQ